MCINFFGMHPTFTLRDERNKETQRQKWEGGKTTRKGKGDEEKREKNEEVKIHFRGTDLSLKRIDPPSSTKTPLRTCESMWETVNRK